ncbi:MAG TPA: polysaccharide biosynthesis C-terminal domain-containing protein, partial [candidate division Zixibacteria bacterium]|nr:polysaccharide biosynthesis C-terminal domain-containing protein [candidate division Zixibacteria bacterium]
FVPYIAAVLGGSRYGVWVIIFQTIFYFSLLDAGLTSALTRYVSKFLAARDFERINRLLNTANLLYFFVGALVFLGIFGFVELFFDYFRISDPETVAEGKTALLILGAFLAFNFIALPFGNTLGAFQRYDLANALAVGEEVVRTLMMVYLLSRGYGLVALALAILVMTVVRHLLGAGLLLQRYPELDIGRRFVEKPSARLLFGYSKISFGISLCWLILFNTDAFLLGLIGSAALAGVYHPGAQLMRYLRNLINAAALPLIPAVSHKDAEGDFGPVRDLYRKSVRYVSYVSFALAAAVVVYARPFVDLWLPPEFAEAAGVMQVLVVGAAFLLPQIVGHAILFGIERHGRLLVVLIIEAALKLGLSIYLIPRYGLVGMAAAVAGPQVLVYTTLSPLFVGRELGISYVRTMGLTLASALAAVAIAGPAAWLARWAIEPLSWTQFFVGLGVVGICALAGAWLIAEREDREQVRAWL